MKKIEFLEVDFLNYLKMTSIYLNQIDKKYLKKGKNLEV
jgi:hypothetical protein